MRQPRFSFKALKMDNGDLTATTHYFIADDFQTQYPALTLVKDVRYVDEGKVMTCSGVTSGMDGALHLIKKYSGDSIAAMLSRAIQYTPREEKKWPVAPNGMKFDRNWKKKRFNQTVN